MDRIRWLLIAERVLGVLFVGWLQLVGVLTHGVLHHVLHALPIIVLLVVRPSPARAFTGLLAGYLWVFMLAAVTSMIHDSLFLGYIVSRPHVAYTWLAPVAALLAVVWAATNAALLNANRWTLPAGVLAGVGLAVGLAWVHPHIAVVFGSPLGRTLDGEYWWAGVLLLETLVVLALPAWGAFRLGRELRASWRFAAWQAVYWMFFVALMVVGLLPSVIRDPW